MERILGLTLICTSLIKKLKLKFRRLTRSPEATKTTNEQLLSDFDQIYPCIPQIGAFPSAMEEGNKMWWPPQPIMPHMHKWCRPPLREIGSRAQKLWVIKVVVNIRIHSRCHNLRYVPTYAAGEGKMDFSRKKNIYIYYSCVGPTTTTNHYC